MFGWGIRVSVRIQCILLFFSLPVLSLSQAWNTTALTCCSLGLIGSAAIKERLVSPLIP